MWPFRRKQEAKKRRSKLEKLIAGIVIGGAIASIVGKKLIDIRKSDEEKQE